MSALIIEWRADALNRIFTALKQDFFPFMQLASPPKNALSPLLHAVAGQQWISGCSPSVDHILLLADRHPDSQGAIDLGIELAERFNARLTLMHGGNLGSDPAFWTSDSLETPDPNQVRLALLGLLWAIRQRCPEVGMCTVSARLPEQVFQAAAQHGADLLVLPAVLFGRFVPLVGGRGRDEAVEGAPCPVLVVEPAPGEHYPG
ncbi:MAG: universal stress protein [Verrucomicrobia bacterium]|nr:universal stress protein [Verrucomicrobiota bacterium]